ncbi:hypothetical protein E4U19_006308, partial [Claviceps sp. Clav32 group G5]
MAQAPTNDDDLTSRVQSLGISPATTIQNLAPPTDTELHPIHPKLQNLEKYISRSWFDSDDRGINLKTATQTDLNDQ